MRVQLLAAVLLPPLVAVPLLIAALAAWGNVYFDRLLVGKVRSDLVVAHGQLEQLLAGVGRQVEALAGAERLARALQVGGGATADLLREVRAGAGLDYLLLIDDDGRVLAASGGAAVGAAYPLPANWRLAPGAHTGVDLFTPQVLAAIDPTLRDKARTPLVATPAARPSRETEETRGLVVHSSAPVPATTRQGAASRRLVGGLLLNQNLDFVDRINEMVYPEGSLPLGSVGTVTLFLGDVRIATNVQLQAGQRAIGTRVSAQVREQVLEEGRTWLDRAFVVDDWYVSAYEPVLDSSGQRAGMLYVGYLEAPLRQARLLALAAVTGLFLFAAGLGAWISLRLARRVSAPVERLHQVMADIEGGDAQARVGRIDGAIEVLEVVELGAHFDRLLDRLAEQRAALQRWGGELDRLVAERTAELAAANATLRSAQQQLVFNEKLAAIGQLAAGIAHEVNNPLAVIQGNLDLAREALGSAAAPAHEELQLMQDQVHRIRQIIAQLLQFARPADASRAPERLALDELLRGSLPLVAHQLRRRHIALREAHAPAPPVLAHRHELQQVLVNLIVNALQALQGQGGGTLWLSTAPSTREGVAGACLRVADDGPGMAPAERERLFTPFFTTKGGSGHGLGLWVSLNLVQRAGGRLEVEHPDAGGCVFTVWLPGAPAGP